MYKLYKGNAPCLGCGRTGEERPRYSKDSLCPDCQAALEIGKTIVKEKELDRKFYSMDELMTANMTWYAIPVQEIDNALRKLLHTFSQFDTRYAKWKGGTQDTYLAGHAGCGTANDRFCIPTITFDAAKELCQTIKDAAWELKSKTEKYREELQAELASEKDRIFNEGVEKGRNILMQLNNNEITPDQFIKLIKKYSK
jgi:hypothetical protein